LSVITNDILIREAKSLGFDLVGFAPAEKLTHEASHLSEWLDQKFNAGMTYMERNYNKRIDVKEILPSAKSVISLGMNYYKEADFLPGEDNGKISRYAWGKDYHLIIWEKLDILLNNLKDIDQQFEAISYVDTGPVMDKAWAVRAGLGWSAKNTNIINKEIGSWFFISTVITNYDFTPSTAVEDFCGSCTACLDACPTSALTPYLLDANKCISYLTIENKGEISSEFIGKFEGWAFGCDICQDVCPWNNKFSVISPHGEFEPKTTSISISEVESMDETQFKLKFSDSPVKRAKLKGIKRNAEFLKSKRN
jgi:epoxyqueuosine reductase